MRGPQDLGSVPSDGTAGTWLLSLSLFLFPDGITWFPHMQPPLHLFHEVIRLRGGHCACTTPTGLSVSKTRSLFIKLCFWYFVAGYAKVIQWFSI